MRMQTVGLAAGGALLVLVSPAFSQVIIRGTEVSNPTTGNSASTTAVGVDTGDRTVVPLLKESSQTKVDANTQRNESVTQERLNDGTYFDWKRSVTVDKTISPGQSVSTTDVVEKDRQGDSHVNQHTDTSVTKTASGETDQTAVYKRDSSGNLVLDHVSASTAVKDKNGTTDTKSMEQTADVNGNLTTLRQDNQVTVSHGPNQQVSTDDSRTVDHLDGQMATTSQQTTTTATQGDLKQTDSVVRAPGDAGWQDTSRTITTETKNPDGSLNRETVVDTRPAYAGSGSSEGLSPQTKVVEHEVHNSDGTTAVQHDVYHRDVNGDWVPETFSTKGADKGLTGSSDMHHVDN
jgi:hypothetical protein